MGLMTARVGHTLSNSMPLRLASYATLAGAGVVSAQYAWGEDFSRRQSAPTWQNHVVMGAGALVAGGTWVTGATPSTNARAAGLILGGSALGAYLVAPMVRRAVAD